MTFYYHFFPDEAMIFPPNYHFSNFLTRLPVSALFTLQFLLESATKIEAPKFEVKSCHFSTQSLQWLPNYQV